jgi:hypothetical protein
MRVRYSHERLYIWQSQARSMDVFIHALPTQQS